MSKRTTSGCSSAVLLIAADMVVSFHPDQLRARGEVDKRVLHALQLVSTSRLLLMATGWRNDSVHPQIKNQQPIVIHGVPQLASRDGAFRLVGNVGTRVGLITVSGEFFARFVCE
jgi:hypothetical protein